MIHSHFPEPSTLDAESLGRAAARLADERPLAPFAPETLAFLGAVSKRLTRHPQGRAYPQIISLGYWLRPAALEKLRGEASALFETAGQVRSPRGLAFHLPPANVDTIFVYSWALSLICGNTNVVRLPSTLSPVAALLLDVLRECAEPPIADLNLFVSYDRNDELTAILSRVCDVRVVWGGDEKVTTIRQIPLPPNAVDLNFANRFSIAAIKTEAYEAIDDAAALALAEHAYNDIFWFDQMGCSSPRIVYWCGAGADRAVAQQRFYRLLSEVSARKGQGGDVGVAVAKTSFAYRAMIDRDVSSYSRVGGVMDVLTLAEPADVRGDVQGGGVLWHAEINDLTELAPTLRREDQTLSYFGFSAAELEAFARAANGRGIDRIVPMGQALNFGRLWDGYDLLSAFTRLTHVM